MRKVGDGGACILPLIKCFTSEDARFLVRLIWKKDHFFFKISMMILCDIIYMYVIKRQEFFPKPFSWGKNIKDFTLFFIKHITSFSQILFNLYEF